MFVFNDNEQDMPFITIYYCSVLVTLFILHMSKIFVDTTSEIEH